MDSAVRDPAGSSLVNSHVGTHTAYPAAGYASHSRSPSDEQGAGQASPVAAGHSLPHGYNHIPPAQDDSSIHPQLRSAGEPAPSNSAYPPVPVPNMMPAAPAIRSPDPNLMSGPIPSLAAPASGIEPCDAADGRKAKRELSQSKRAAQNRAAQRAFRQRKEGYIKKLEQQVKDFTEMEAGFKNTQAENYALREYIIHLQSRLLDSLGEYPQPPPNISLSLPHPPSGASEATQTAVSSNPLEVAAQAVAGLSRSEHLARDHYAVKYEPSARSDDDARTAEEITRQLADSTSEGLQQTNL